MRILIILFTGFLFLQSAHAHNMREGLKKQKIKRALAHITTEIADHQIDITPNPLSWNLDFQWVRLDPGDKDIDDVTVYTQINGEEYKITCEVLSGEYGREKPIYFMVYENCTKTNMYNYKTKSISLAKQEWTDWKY